MVCCGVNPKVVDKYSTFADACYTGNLDRMREILRKNGRRAERIINERGADGYTPLHRAAQRGNLDVIQFLLERRADPCILSKQGESVFHIAAFHRKRLAVKEFLKTAAQSLLDQQDKVHSMTALQLAIYRGAYPIAEVLLEAGANPRIRDKYGNTAIEFAQFGASQLKGGFGTPSNNYTKILSILKQYASDFDDTPSTNFATPSEAPLNAIAVRDH